MEYRHTSYQHAHTHLYNNELTFLIDVLQNLLATFEIMTAGESTGQLQ